MNELVGNLLDVEPDPDGSSGGQAAGGGARRGDRRCAAAVCPTAGTRSGSTSPRPSPWSTPTRSSCTQRAIANIVDNTLQFAGARRSSARRGRLRSRGRVRVAFPVVDTGPGIPPGPGARRCSDRSSASATAPTAPGLDVGLAVAPRVRGGDGWRYHGGGHSRERRHDGAQPPRGRLGDPSAGDRRRGAVRQGAGDQPARPRVRGRRGQRRRGGVVAPPPATIPTWSCSTSGYPGIDGLDVLAALRGWTTGAGGSCSRHATSKHPRSTPSTKVPTTTSPSRSGWTSCSARLRALQRRGGTSRRRRPPSRRPPSPSTSRPSGRGRGVGARVTPHPQGVAVSSRCSCATRASSCRSGECSRTCRALEYESTETDYLPRVHRGGAEEARAGAQPAALLHHRAGHGLPVRARRGLTVELSDLQEPLRRPTGRGRRRRHAR